MMIGWVTPKGIGFVYYFALVLSPSLNQCRARADAILQTIGWGRASSDGAGGGIGWLAVVWREKTENEKEKRKEKKKKLPSLHSYWALSYPT